MGMEQPLKGLKLLFRVYEAKMKMRLTEIQHISKDKKTVKMGFRMENVLLKYPLAFVKDKQIKVWLFAQLI